MDGTDFPGKFERQNATLDFYASCAFEQHHKPFLKILGKVCISSIHVYL